LHACKKKNLTLFPQNNIFESFWLRFYNESKIINVAKAQNEKNHRIIVIEKISCTTEPINKLHNAHHKILYCKTPTSGTPPEIVMPLIIKK